MSTKVFSKKELYEEILREGRVLGLHSGAVEMIAERTVEATAKWINKRGKITQKDLERQIARELKKYNPDLTYVYENRGRII